MEYCFILDLLGIDDYCGASALLRDIEMSLYYVLLTKNSRFLTFLNLCRLFEGIFSYGYYCG